MTRLQSAKEPTKAQRRSIEALALQNRGEAAWHFARFSNNIFVLVPRKSYCVAPGGKATLVRSNRMGLRPEGSLA